MRNIGMFFKSTGRRRVQRKWVQPENKRAAHQTPIFVGNSERSGLKFASEIENFERNLFFSILEPLQNPTKSSKIRLYPLRLYPVKRPTDQDRAMRNACDSDSGCGCACDASARDATCEPLMGQGLRNARPATGIRNPEPSKFHEKKTKISHQGPAPKCL